MSENLEIKVGLSVDEEKAKIQMNQALSSLKELAGNKANNINIKFNIDKTGLADLEKIEKAVKELNKLSKETQKSLFDFKGNNSAAKSIEEQQKLYDQRRKQEIAYAEMFDKIEKQEKRITNIKQKEAKEQERINKSTLDAIAKQEATQLAKAQKERAKSFDSISKDMQKAWSKVGKLEKSGFVDMSELDKVKSSLKEISDIHVWDNIDKLDLSHSRAEIEKVQESLKQIDDLRLDGLKNAKVDNFTSKMASDLDKLESKFKEIGKSTEGIDRLKAELQSLDSVAPDKLPTTFQRMRQEVSELNGELRQATKETSGMSGFLGDIYDSMSTFTLGNMIGDGIVSSIRSVTDSFIEMDDAITNVKKVAEATDVNSTLKLDNIKSQAIDIAKEVGMATTDVINGIADSLQAGMGSMEQSIAVARSSLMLANVGDMTQADASSAVNTMIKGFKIQPLKEVQKEMNGTIVKTNELSEAMDILNFAGNNYAIGSDGVAEALKRGGTVLSEYGVSLGDTVALITAANEAIQNPEKVGNGMKSIAINLAGMKANASEGTMELNKTAKALSEIAGIDVYADKKNGQIKNMVTILDEVQKKWGSLRDDQRKALSEAIAGKEQAAIFQSLMGNFKAFKKMREEFDENLHIGSAEAENTQYVNSISGKLNHLRETWVSISQTIVSSDFTKGLLDGAIKVSEAIDKIVKALDKMGMLTPTLVAVGTTFGKMLKTMVGNSREGLSLFELPQKSGGIFSAIKKDIKEMESSGKIFVRTGGEIKKSFSNIGAGISSATKFVGSFIAQGALIAGVTVAVQGLAKAWDEMAHGLENAEKEIKTNISDLNESISSNKADLKYLEETEERYNELINKKKEYSKIPADKMTDKQLADMQELKEITFELAEKFPQLVMGYDSEGSPIMLMANDMEKLKKRTEEQIELEQKLLKAEREKLANNSRKQVQEGNFFGLGQGIAEKMETKEATYNSLFNSVLGGQKGFLKAMSDGDMKYAQQQLKVLNKQKESLKNNYKERLDLYQQYSQKELEIQQSAFDQIQNVRGYDKLDEAQVSSVQRFIDNLNWANLDESQYNTWINGSKELIQLAQSGSPKLEDWNKKLEKAKDIYADNGDLGEYEKSLKNVAKAISEDLNIPYETVFAGLVNMVEPLSDTEQAMQRFLTTFGKTRHDLLNGDSIAQGLAEQFEAVNSVINNILGNESSYKANGSLTYDMAIQIANKDALPNEVQKLVRELAQGGVTEQESKIIVDLMYVLQEGDTKQARDKLKELNESLSELGKEPVKIETLFDTKGLEQAQQLEDVLNKLRKEKSTANIEVLVDGQDKAQLYLDIINKLKTNSELTNKFIVENQDALSQLESYEEVVKWLQQNPDIVSKYKIEGIEQLEKAKQEKKEVEKEGEGKTKVVVTTDGDKELIELNAVVEDTEGEKSVKMTVDNGQVLDSIEDIETLIKYSSQMEDGAYRLDIQANTQDAVTQLGALEAELRKISNIMLNTPTKTYKIETAQASKNVTGLRNNISKLQGLMSKNTAMVFKSETAQASKNITGLINNIKRCNSTKPKTIKFNSETAQASKNITGLINKIKSVPTGKKTITYEVITKYKTEGTSTSHSKNSGAPKSMPQQAAFVENQPSVANVAPVSEFASSDVAAASETSVANEPQQINSRASVSRPKMTIPTPIAITGRDIHDSIKYSIELLQELENRITKVTSQLSLLDKKMKHATGEQKIAYLKQQNFLYEEQLQLQKDLEDKLLRQKNYYEYFLKSKGFQFTSDGNLKNYEEKLILMEKEQERLEKIAETKRKAESDYKGDNDKQKDKLSKEAEKAQENADNYKKSLDEIKKFLNAYIEVATQELPKVQEEFINIENAIKDNINSIKQFEKELGNLRVDSGYKDNNRDIWEVENKLNQNQINLDNSTGKKHLEYLEERIKLTQQLGEETKQLLSFENQRRKDIMNDLKGYGFSFREDGTIEGYSQKIEQLKKSLTEDEFNEAFSKVEDYLNTTYEKIPELNDQILELGYSVDKYRNELKKLERERALEPHLNKIKEVENEYDKLADKLSLIDIRLKDAYGKEKLQLMEQQIKLLKKQREEQSHLVREYEAMAKVYRNTLEADFDVKFDAQGDILNVDAVLNNYRDHKDFEVLKELVDEYLDIQRDKLPEVQKEWESLGATIKSAYKEQLNTTKEIENEITSIYKKQVEERKKLIDEELKKRLDAINKEKEAYNKAREEAKYQDNYNDQMDKVKELEKQLEIAKKDTSLAGQKKVQDLLKQLKDEQKKLQDMVQDKIDDQINDMFDKESDRLQEESDKIKEDLDNQFSDKKIQELVKEALNTGVFEDIDGTMRSLQDVMLAFVDEYGEGLGATGQLIKSELVANLEVAKNTMKDMVNIAKELGVIQYSYDNNILNNASRSIPQERNTRGLATTINFNESLINVEGNVDQNIVEELKAISKEIEENVVGSIVRELR